MSEAKKDQKVILIPKGAKDELKQEFSVSHANKLLNLRNTQWELSDPAWTHNGTELLSKNAKAAATTTKTDTETK